jgi:hypothetical protein
VVSLTGPLNDTCVTRFDSESGDVDDMIEIMMSCVFMSGLSVFYTNEVCTRVRIIRCSTSSTQVTLLTERIFASTIKHVTAPNPSYSALDPKSDVDPAIRLDALLRGVEPQPMNSPFSHRNSPDKPQSGGFSFAWFFLVFWLTLILTVAISWSMIT